MSVLSDRNDSLMSHHNFINHVVNIPFNLCDIMEMSNEEHFYINSLYYHKKYSRHSFTKEYGISCLKLRYLLRRERLKSD